MSNLDLSKIKKIVEKFGFEAEIVEGYSDYKGNKNENGEFIYDFIANPSVIVYANNTDGKRVKWFMYDSVRNVYSGDNTDCLNIWLYETRPDLTPEMLVEMFTELHAKLKVLVDPEDWQEIAGVNDACEDKRYADMEIL